MDLLVGPDDGGPDDGGPDDGGPDDARELWPAAEFGYLKQKLTLSGHGDPARPAAIRFSDFGDVDELIEVRPPTGESALEIAREGITGHYRSAATGTEAIIVAADKGPVLRTIGRFGATEYNLRCLAPDIWRADNDSPAAMGGILTFADHNATFWFTSARTRALPFRRRA